MIRALLDTNVLASGFTNRLGASGQLLLAWSQRKFELIYSEQIWSELERTFEDRYFARRLAPEQRQANLTLLRDEATLTQVTTSVSGVATHPEDDLVLAAAVSAGAAYLVTGDDRFRRRVGTHQGVTLISPREFLELLEQVSDD